MAGIDIIVELNIVIPTSGLLGEPQAPYVVFKVTRIGSLDLDTDTLPVALPIQLGTTITTTLPLINYVHDLTVVRKPWSYLTLLPRSTGVATTRPETSAATSACSSAVSVPVRSSTVIVSALIDVSFCQSSASPE